MIQFETTKATILFVEVPEDAFMISVAEYASWMLHYSIKGHSHYVQLESGPWQFITLLKDAREEHAREILPVYSLIHPDLFQNYQNDFYIESQFKTALESLHSLATSLGVKGNAAVLVKVSV